MKNEDKKVVDVQSIKTNIGQDVLISYEQMQNLAKSIDKGSLKIKS
jgi:hypothetical protein